MKQSTESYKHTTFTQCIIKTISEIHNDWATIMSAIC